MTIQIHASELGACHKSTVAKLLHYTPTPIPEPLAASFALGHTIEGEVIRWLEKEQAFNFSSYQSEYTINCGEIEDESVQVVCHTDGEASSLSDKLGVGSVEGVVVEVKSASPKSYAEWEQKKWGRTDSLWEKYKWQVSCYIVATGKPVLFVVQSKEDRKCGRCEGKGVLPDSEQPDWLKDSWEVASQCSVCSGTGRLPLESGPNRSWDLITAPFHPHIAIIARARKIASHVQAMELPRDCDRDDFFCSFSYLHESAYDEGGEWEKEAQEYYRRHQEFKAETKRLKDEWEEYRTRHRRKLLQAVGVKEGDNGFENQGSKKKDSGRVMIAAHWGPVGPVTWRQDLMVADGVNPEKYKEQKRGYRVNVKVREEE